MMKKCIWLITLVPFLAFQTVPASACNVVGYGSDGEPLCATTSDGAGQPYIDASSHRRRVMDKVHQLEHVQRVMDKVHRLEHVQRVMDKVHQQERIHPQSP
jgi:hypothetical protein